METFVENKFLLHPIIAWPQRTFSPEAMLELAEDAGFGGLVIGPMRGYDMLRLWNIPPDKVGAVEGAWHPLTSNNVFQLAALLRVFGLRSAEHAAFPWDNLFWGDKSLVKSRWMALEQLFQEAIFSGHSPENEVRWPGPYAWEINPDHGITGREVFDVRGKFAVDLYHLKRPARKEPHRSVVEGDLVAFVQELVERRAQDICLIHLHLGAAQVLPFSVGIVPEELRQCFRLLATIPARPPVAVQFLPMVPLNLTYWSTVAFLRRIREVAEGLLEAGRLPVAVPAIA